ncbi:signal recognition particle-docking protein FtsY [Allorhizobium sp. BGMRC 0089]|uniref:signal recognition particle-docking protein FtsY n=1 Tax=Allorhizobium sonneratiae TaxID=2934936 RepID=UPI0020339C05|nr:signal recognition particle-docking protein FtsY [Allorhizobium sonneratiae]MCM2293357.1 signal recognition particle-docking protein FtsY [Allorhizobium sonneratiae]
MALGFIKKVFTFGKDAAKDGAQDAKPEPLEVAEHPVEPVIETPVDLPLAEDPVLPEEMETAGGPADDLTSETEQEEAIATPQRQETEDDPAAAAEAQAVDQHGLDDTLPSPEPETSVAGEDDGETQNAEAQKSDIALPKGFATNLPVADETPQAQPKLSWFQRLKAGLFRTSTQLSGQISALFTKRKLDEDTLEELEDLLIQADLGVETAMRVTDALSSERYGKDVSGDDVARIMAGEITKVLKPVAKPLALDLNHKPHVILVVGVNGTGKTTTIGKLAAKLSGAGLKVMLAAGDTFRAAAIEQLKIWADRTGSTFIGTKLGADAAGLAYDAFEKAKAEKSDVLIIDTAGRLQNKTELMAELEKIVRVLAKLDPDAPHTVLQTLDATTGQNALQQVEIFRNIAGVNGLVMTKLDGTARGGILVAIAAKHRLPVYFIGVGEGIDDLEPFEAEDFARAIAGVAP